MFYAHQLDRWDHTAQLLAAWSKGADPRDMNPYRARERRNRGGMTPAELHAIRKSLAARNAARKASRTESS